MLTLWHKIWSIKGHGLILRLFPYNLSVDKNVLIRAYCEFVTEQDGLDIATQS